MLPDSSVGDEADKLKRLAAEASRCHQLFYGVSTLQVKEVLGAKHTAMGNKIRSDINQTQKKIET